MIHGIGTDIVAVARLRAMWEKHGEHVLRRLLASAERGDFERAPDKGRFLAKRFAAKEAFSKAFGTGLLAPVTLTNIAIVHDAAGKPAFAYGDDLAALLAARRLVAHLSISDEADYALAYVILEGS